MVTRGLLWVSEGEELMSLLRVKDMFGFEVRREV